MGIFDLSRSISIRWHYQWFLADGVSHLLFLAVLAAMMYLWAPHTNSQRYAYSHQVDGDDKDEDSMNKSSNVWAPEDGLDDDGDDESFWAATHGKKADTKPISVAPDRIGADESGAAAERS